MLSTGESVVAPNILNALLDVVLNQQTPQYVSAALLSVLTSVNSEVRTSISCLSFCNNLFFKAVLFFKYYDIKVKIFYYIVLCTSLTFYMAVFRIS